MNSPLITAVVGTSTAAPPPNAPLTPAMMTTSARPATEAEIVRLLFRHMSLHGHSRFEAGRNNHLVVVHCAERHCARPGTVAVHHSHRERIVLAPAFALRASALSD